MEKPLLGETSCDYSFRERDHHTSRYNRRSDAIAYGSRFQKAAALVDLAVDGVGLPEKILDQPNFEAAAKFYFVYFQFGFIWTLNYFALIILNFLEKPLWCSNYSAYFCQDRDYFYLGQLPYLTSTESVIYEGITVIILIAHIFFPISFEGTRIFWRNPLNLLKVICLSILVADLLVYAIYLSPVAIYYLPLRIAPYIRVILFILSIRDLQKSIVILAGMLGTYLNFLALFLLFLLFSSWVAYVMFEDTEQGKTVFTSYGTTLYQMFILFTTSNNPDVWIPAYKASRWYCLFFVLYVLLGVYFVTNLILAVVYDSFKGQLAKQVSEADSLRKRMLVKAFNLIDKHNVGVLNKEQSIRLFEELNKYSYNASILISSTPFNSAERVADINLSLPGYAFDLVTRAKTALELSCPNTVSCADILAIATRNLVTMMGGPYYIVLLDRKYYRICFGIQEMEALSWAHTIGFSYCKEFRSFVYNGTHYNPRFAQGLQKTCKNYPKDPTLLVFNDIMTPNKFDNMYFQNLPFRVRSWVV